VRLSNQKRDAGSSAKGAADRRYRSGKEDGCIVKVKAMVPGTNR